MIASSVGQRHPPNGGTELGTPPKSRNEALASRMRRFRICEERASGIDKVVFEVELFQLPAPLFEAPEGSHGRSCSPTSLCLRWTRRTVAQGTTLRAAISALVGS
jgi:hypothetical protein